jgi:hypothetical protein
LKLKNLWGVADGTKQEAEGVLIDVQVEVGNFKLLADIVVRDMPECPVTLERLFLATEKDRINLEYKEIVLESEGDYLIHHLSQGNI